MNSILSLATLLMSSTPMNADHPITLATAARDGAVDLIVSGRAAVPVRARYTLEVRSGSSGNRSVQSGEAAQRPGQPVSLVHLTLGGDAATRWTATLEVETEGGRPYREVLSAPEEGPE
jgi:hypothetical protein